MVAPKDQNAECNCPSSTSGRRLGGLSERNIWWVVARGGCIAGIAWNVFGILDFANGFVLASFLPMKCNVAIHCTLVVRNVVIVGLG